jgi:hypothetical protein
MANSKISDLNPTGGLTLAHLMEVESAGGASEKALLQKLKTLVAGLTELAYYDATASGATAGVIASVVGYDEALVVFKNVTLAAAGWRCLLVSTDGGVNYDTANNYPTSDTSGVVANSGIVFCHSTSSASARSCEANMCCLQSARALKPYYTPFRTIPGGQYIGAGPITHVKAVGFTSPGFPNITGGQIAIFGR